MLPRPSQRPRHGPQPKSCGAIERHTPLSGVIVEIGRGAGGGKCAEAVRSRPRHYLVEERRPFCDRENKKSRKRDQAGRAPQ